ncbi:MAG: hypothetical protein WCR72_13900, partial [Bacteroidota bacterium]
MVINLPTGSSLFLNIFLITTVHQNFDAYALGLNNSQKQEWTKVKGRFREITFNEPVEQLLYLASENKKESSLIKKYSRNISKSIELIIESKSFNVNEKYVKSIAQKLFPLDIISAYVLTKSLQKYGQNERSLFSFLESTDHTGLSQHEKIKNGFYGIPEVYEFLIFNYFAFLNSKYNPDFSGWKSIKIALEKAESAFDVELNSALKIIKIIGLLNINSQAGANLSKEFLIEYCDTCTEIKKSSAIIDELIKKKIIIFRNYNKRFAFFEGTDLDIEIALIEASGKVDDVTDVVTLLNKYYQLPPIIAKKSLYLTGTPRLFEYKISSSPINDIPSGDIDGYINLVFSEKNLISEIKAHSLENKEAVIYCYYKNSKSIKDLLFEIEKTKKVIEENSDDKVAIRELNNIILHQQNLLTHKILNNFSTNRSEVCWIYNGEILTFKNKRVFNSKLSEICDNVYFKAPVLNNELVNKHKISGSIHSAKRNYLKALVNNWDKPQLDFPKDNFPPEKTIYLTLLENNNITLYSDKIISSIKPNDINKFDLLWEVSISFLDSAKVSKRSITEFIDILSKRPFKLKQGLIDFWVPTFLFIKRDDFALFDKTSYIPNISENVLDLIGKNPDHYEIKSFSIDGVKLDIFNSYRLIINKESKEKLSNSSFIETIKPFLTFYKDLPEYTKNTTRLSEGASSIRNVIANSKDPEKTFFEEFPNALGYSINQIQQSNANLNEYIKKLQSAIKELRTAYDELQNRFESYIVNEIIGQEQNFEEYKESLQKRYSNLKKHMLLHKQKVFVQRLDSKIEDKKAWLNSIAQALVNIPLEKFKDEDELVVYDNLKSIILELDNLTAISNSNFKEDIEEVFDLQINSFVDGLSKQLVRLPKNKKKEINKIQESLKDHLSDDKSLNIA